MIQTEMRLGVTVERAGKLLRFTQRIVHEINPEKPERRKYRGPTANTIARGRRCLPPGDRE